MSDVTVAGMLDGEERGREGAQAFREKFLPVDTPRAPSDYFDWTKSFRLDESEARRFGSYAGYLEQEMIGGGESGAEKDVDNEAAIVANWKSLFPGKEFPYDFDSGNQAREIEMQLARRDIEGGVMGSLARGEVYDGVTKLEGKGGSVEVSVDPMAIRNEEVRRALIRQGGQSFVKDVWKNAGCLTLYFPYKDARGWVIKVETRDKRVLAMSLGDFERMFFITTASGKQLIDLPDSGDGSPVGAKDLLSAVGRLKVDGEVLPNKIDIALEVLR